MKKARRILLFLSILLIGLILSACGNESSKDVSTTNESENDTDSSEIYEWDFNLHVNLDQGPGVYMTKFTESVKERTNGRLNIIPRPPGELPYTGMESVRVVGDGSIEMADAPIGYIAGDVKTSAIPTWPFLVSEDMETFGKSIEAIGPYIDEELSEFGIESLFFLQDPPQRFWGVGEPVKSLDDLKGLKIRTFAPEQQVFLKELGAIPVSLAFSEITTALQRGVIDAAITGAIGAYDAKWYDIIDYGYAIPFSGSGAFMLINSDALAGLPEDIQEIVREEAAKWQEIGNEESIAYEAEAIQGLIDNGVEINESTPEDFAKAQELIKPFYSEWVENEHMEEALNEVLEIIK